ncbi:MAG TPA: phosphotransferase family protein [Acidimicrobiales bacterium]|nr:phosphotransferase family protein [Acidimicrobiales bacterium]
MSGAPPAGDPGIGRLAGLAAWLDAHGDGATHEVVAVERPAAGYSSETVLVDVRRHPAPHHPHSGTTVASPAPPAWSQNEGGADDEVVRLVVKLPPAGPAIFPAYDFALQAAVQEAVAAAGIPVAVPAQSESDERWLGAPFLVMPAVAGHIVGEVPALDRRLAAAGADAKRALHTAFVERVADINRVDWRAAGLGDVLPRRDNGAELASWWDYLAWYADGEVVVPALVDALDWCEAHRPTGEPGPSLRWGDVRLENVVVDDDLHPVAVLDWEMASLGAAEHDLAWLTTLQATQDALVGRTVDGFLGPDEVVATYETRLGRPVQDLAWYEALAALRSTAILTRIAHLNDQRGEPNFFPIADNPLVDRLRALTHGH